MSERSERIAVVGGGIIGVLIANEIARRDPAAEVVLLERDMVASGASRRSAGLHFPRGASERVRRMSEFSEDWYARLAASDPAVPIRPLAMTVVASPDRADDVHEAYLPSAKLTATAVSGDEDVLLPPGSLAWTAEGGQYADVGALAEYLVRRLPTSVRVREGVAVTCVRSAYDDVRLTLSTGEVAHADRVVLAPGPWITHPAWRYLLAPLDVRVKRIVALHIDKPAGPRDTCVVLHDEDAFLLPLAHRGHWLFSYTCQEWDVDPDRAASGLRETHLAEAAAILGRYAPALATRPLAGRVFCDAYTTDRQPLIRALGPTGRVVFAGGANGSGYRLAPAIAAHAVDQLDLKGP